MMNLILKRLVFTNESTIGQFYIGDQFECFCLEDTVRDHKVKGKTAIPSGTYEVIINFSNRFKRPMPLLLDVPGFSGIRIHCGNTAKDTDGCLLLGKEKQTNQVLKSKEAFDEFFPKLEAGLKVGKAFLTVVGGTSSVS